MIFKSIKWRLQIGYGLVLAAVLTGLVCTSYQMERTRQYSNIQMEMNSHTGMIADSMRFPPPPRPDQPDQPPRQRPFPPDHPPGRLHLPPRDDLILTNAFDATGTNGFYYAIWTWDGTRELMRSANAPSDVPPPVGHEWTRVRGIYREDCVPIPAEMLPGPHMGYRILVGRSIAPELYQLHRTLLILTCQAIIICLIGLLIGSRVAARAIQPIAVISTDAAKISAGDLSRRINVAETESELGKLAAVLNSTFARLETAFAQQRQFTADAAHELRTPVSVMLTQTQTALNRERSANDYKQAVEACQRAAQRMRKLIESLLELARLDAGQEPLKRLKFDLSQTAWDCVELVRPLAAARGVTIHSDLQPIEGHGDAERLGQVITNLLANAVQYNKDNGEVRISAKVQASMILLAVSDTGPGISSADLPHVFDRFYRADPSRSSGQTGLGLAISKAIVEAHGGSIDVASTPGAGTTFTVVLPAT